MLLETFDPGLITPVHRCGRGVQVTGRCTRGSHSSPTARRLTEKGSVRGVRAADACGVSMVRRFVWAWSHMTQRAALTDVGHV